MKPLLMRMQRTRIFAVCEKLFENILLQIQKDNLSDKNLKVLEMAQTALAKLTMSEFMKIKTVIIDEDGVTTTATNSTQTINGKTQADPNMFAQARMLHEEQGDRELASLVYYLKENRRQFAEVEEQYPDKPKSQYCQKCWRNKSGCECHRQRKIFHL